MKALLLAVVLAWPAGVQAQMYKCVDERGGVGDREDDQLLHGYFFTASSPSPDGNFAEPKRMMSVAAASSRIAPVT